ncbi:MAG: hypothetical protein SPL86_01965 [Succiniclasticum sp.]|uniref:hypothetical protein n=1 Tax=Succiniclasticum sp. TaxID=2775030 RepID=UPI002A90E593|nr:hypothetical protein [Succiniclasticum sp.]MDY6290230.1 hypothetical protein [Succiniclasticum sp.]
MKKRYVVISRIKTWVLDERKIINLAKEVSDGHWYIFMGGHENETEKADIRIRCILIRSDYQSAADVYDYIYSKMLKIDKELSKEPWNKKNLLYQDLSHFFVIEVSDNYKGFLEKSHWDYIDGIFK